MISLGETFVMFSEWYHCHVLLLWRHYLNQVGNEMPLTYSGIHNQKLDRSLSFSEYDCSLLFFFLLHSFYYLLELVYLSEQTIYEYSVKLLVRVLLYSSRCYGDGV